MIKLSKEEQELFGNDATSQIARTVFRFGVFIERALHLTARIREIALNSVIRKEGSFSKEELDRITGMFTEVYLLLVVALSQMYDSYLDLFSSASSDVKSCE